MFEVRFRSRSVEVEQAARAKNNFYLLNVGRSKPRSGQSLSHQGEATIRAGARLPWLLDNGQVLVLLRDLMAISKAMWGGPRHGYA